MICAFLTSEIFALAGVEVQLQLGTRTPAPVPYLATMAADREQSRGPHRFATVVYYPMGEPSSFLVPHAMPNRDDYHAIPLTLWAERRAFHRAKDMSCDDTAAPLRAPAQALQASPLRI
jgi:hypothetical protein